MKTRIAALVCAIAVTAACATKINKVLVDPSRYRDREVKISGRVADSVSIAERGAYRVVDSTGEIWVVSQTGVPRVGAQVNVRGTIREGFNLGALAGRIKLPAGVSSGLVLVESSHSAR